MKKISWILIVPILMLTSCFEQDIPETAPETVESVDLASYLGVWYEIASYPQFFSIGCNCTTAEYQLNAAGNVKVTNRCNLLGANGPENKVVGSAIPIPNSNFAKLSVSFAPGNNANNIGNYWILELADDYSYAVVSDPFRGTWFLLSRTPEFDNTLYNEIVDRAVADGFIRSKIVKTNQDCN
jgi:apolipoprotein D and lipocalin family protein